MSLNSLQKIRSSPGTRKSIEITLAVLWGIAALAFVAIILFSIFGGSLTSSAIDPKTMRPASPESQNPGFASSSRLPKVSWKTSLFGGLVYPGQIFVLENGQPLPGRACAQDVPVSDGRGCYALQMDSRELFIASTDQTYPGTNGKQYEMAWRWKPSPVLAVAVLIAWLILSLAWARFNPKLAASLSKLRDYLVNRSTTDLFFVSFFIAFLLFFLFPVFLNQARVLRLSGSIPTTRVIGADHYTVVNQFSRPLVVSGERNFQGMLYPPLVAIANIPFVFLNDYDSYALMTLLSVICFMAISVFVPRMLIDGKQRLSLLLFFFLSGLYSYGLQFELERGQWNVVCMFLVLLAIWIFHKHYKYRAISYLLFTVAVQLKLYPFIFIFGFIKDWRDWKDNIRRFAGLGLLNVAALFMLGFNNPVSLVQTASTYVKRTISINNHSIFAFTTLFLNTKELVRLRPYSALLQYGLILLVLGCVLFICYQAYRKDRRGPDPLLILGCTAAALLIPSLSNDYTLPLLVAPIAMIIAGNEEFSFIKKGLVPSLLVFMITLAYCSTLYSYVYKSIFSSADLLYFASPSIHVPFDLLIRNNCPALLLIVFGAACLTFYLEERKIETSAI